MRRLFLIALRLYPVDYRLRFGAEMLAVFEQAGNARASSAVRIRFMAVEFLGVLGSAVREWAAKMICDPTSRARQLPDCRLMRPVGVTRREWSAGLEAISFEQKGMRG